MLKQSLNGTGTLEIIGKDSGLLPKGIVSADIPGSVYATLLKEELIPDPYYRDNELKVLPLMDNDFVYRRTFTAEEALFDCEEVLLHFAVNLQNLLPKEKTKRLL